MSFKTSSGQLAKMRARERFRSVAYPDGETNGVQNYSIGYGHQIRPNEQSLKRRAINVSEGEKMFAADVAPVETIVGNALPRVNQNQGDALVDFGYNAGTGALANVLVTWKTTKGDIAATTAHMAKYHFTHVDGVLVSSKELMNRRNASNSLFATPVAKSLAVLFACTVGVTLYLLKA